MHPSLKMSCSILLGKDNKLVIWVGLVILPWIELWSSQGKKTTGLDSDERPVEAFSVPSQCAFAPSLSDILGVGQKCVQGQKS